MTDVVRKTQTEIDEAAYARLTDWLQDQSNIEKLLSGLLAPGGTLEAEFEAHRNSLDVDQATGGALDLLGAAVGEARKNRTDDLYRIFVKARILVNKSRGNTKDIYGVLRLLVDPTNTLDIVKYSPAHFHAIVGETPPAQIVSMLQIASEGKSAGVGFTGVYHTAASTSMFTIGAQGDYPETDNDTGVGNAAGTVGGQLAGCVSKNFEAYRDRTDLHNRLSSWAEVANTSSEDIYGMRYADGTWIAVGDSTASNGGYIIRSIDNGATWSAEISNPKTFDLNDVTKAGSSWLACGVADGSDGYLVRSVDDGLTWVEISNDKNVTLTAMAYGGGALIVVGYADGGDAYCLRSTDDGASFIEIATPKNKNLYALTYSAGTWIACGEADGADSFLIRSTDGGLTWSEITNPENEDLFGIAADGAGAWLAAGSTTSSSEPYIIRSADDGLTWASIPLGTTSFAYALAVAYDNAWVIAGEADGTDADLWTSYTGLADTWTEQTNPKNESIYAMAIRPGIKWLCGGSADGTDSYMLGTII